MAGLVKPNGHLRTHQGHASRRQPSAGRHKDAEPRRDGSLSKRECGRFVANHCSPNRRASVDWGHRACARHHRKQWRKARTSSPYHRYSLGSNLLETFPVAAPTVPTGQVDALWVVGRIVDMIGTRSHLRNLSGRTGLELAVLEDREVDAPTVILVK